MTVIFYGIPNCDTVKKARDWLGASGIAYVFHDYKKQGADPVRIAQWVEQAGWERVLNRAGTTFRKLPEADREGLDAAKLTTLQFPGAVLFR
jgi:Spx/MgsR family transcriptional regulator